jgi:hypothetical protein
MISFWWFTVLSFKKACSLLLNPLYRFISWCLGLRIASFLCSELIFCLLATASWFFLLSLYFVPFSKALIAGSFDFVKGLPGFSSSYVIKLYIIHNKRAFCSCNLIISWSMSATEQTIKYTQNSNTSLHVFYSINFFIYIFITVATKPNKPSLHSPFSLRQVNIVKWQKGSFSVLKFRKCSFLLNTLRSHILS